MVLVVVAASVLIIACHHEVPEKNMAEMSLIPLPESITPQKGAFRLKSHTIIAVDKGNEELLAIGHYLAGLLKPATGIEFKVKTTSRLTPGGDIRLTLTDNEPDLGKEGYDLGVTPRRINIRANTPAGIFYGIQTLRQLLPPAIEKKTVQEGPWLIPAGTICDYPVYEYRGMMLDVARHFFPPEDVKQLIDEMVLFKLNRLHLHLSDDQGWRIEIKSWPKLTEIGGSTEVGGGKGGYYTQEQYKDLVAYAASRYITVIPEIDMPGHTNAALASYAELNCDGKARKLYTGTEVGFSTFCTQKEEVYKFLDDVIGEISNMTPGPWFHIGGDESHVTPLMDYIPFINRAQQIVTQHGKQVIGWDEISHADLQPNTIVQYWARAENAKRAVEKGAKVIISPADRCYLDMQYDSTTTLGLHWAGYVGVDKAYNWDPAKLVPGIGREQIVGVESPLWSETVTNRKEMEYMIFPRLAGHAEIGWSVASRRDWEDYRERLGAFAPRFEAMDINFYRSPLIDWKE
jgi:hexosaminidase